MRTIFLLTLLAAAPASAQLELGDPTEDTISPLRAMREIERLELQLETTDTSAPVATLITGISMSVLGAGGLGTGGALIAVGNSNTARDFAAGSFVIGGAMLLVGIILVIAGGSWLPAVNQRRTRLNRRIEDYRRFLPNGGLALTPSGARFAF